MITHSWVEPFLRSRQLCSYWRTSQHFMEPEGSLSCSQEPYTGTYPEPDQSNPCAIDMMPKLINVPQIICIYLIYLSMALQSFLSDLGRFFSLLILYRVGRNPWTSDQPLASPLPAHRITQTQNKRTQTSMSWVRFETTIPAFERAKTVHALERAATVIGALRSHASQNLSNSIPS
jgi:hypothetical protein